MKNINRRDFLKSAAAGSALFALNKNLFAQESPQAPMGKAKAVIQIWLWGGPCHIDTFDPKPKAGNDYSGPYTSVIPTKTDGMFFNSNLPELAKLSDKLAVVRSMSHGTNAHETGSYLVQTGRMPDKDVYPCVGAVMSKLRGYDAGYKGVLPPYIVLTKPQGRFSESGFLGNKYKPFATGGDPAKNPFEVEGIIAAGVSEQRQKTKKEMLEILNTYKKLMKESPALARGNLSQEQAYELILGDAGKIFDLSKESPKTHERYGKTTFGQSCLMARRLVEQGVPYITVNSSGWDTHKLHFQEMNRMLPALDRGVSALITDLAERGMLEDTIVWLGGEFGRAPRIQWTPPFSGGRGHWGHAFSTVMAGGGFKGGTLVGTTDDKGEFVKERPVHPTEMIATIYNRLGIPADTKLRHPQGHELPVVEPNRPIVKEIV